MSETSRNWDFSRLAYMDVVVMQIAIAEMLTFPNIPVSVTINEYVELAKLYSTPRSGGYINGMLDAIARYLIDTGKMFKQMPERRQPRNNNERSNRNNNYSRNEANLQNDYPYPEGNVPQDGLEGNTNEEF